jgi:hypothetical protein
MEGEENSIDQRYRSTETVPDYCDFFGFMDRYGGFDGSKDLVSGSPGCLILVPTKAE